MGKYKVYSKMYHKGKRVKFLPGILEIVSAKNATAAKAKINKINRKYNRIPGNNYRVFKVTKK